jgi:hypothetical protein
MKILSKTLVVLIFFFIFSPITSAIEYNKIGGRPAFPRAENSRTEDIFVHTLEPGVIQEEGIRVINNTSEQKNVLVYARDSTPSTDGGFACLQFSQENSGVGSWIVLEKEEVTIGPNSNEIIPFNINVPVTASVGEHNGCILIQEKKDSGKKAGINLAIRTGLRVIVNIPGDIVQDLTFVDYDAQKRDDGSFLLIPTVQNNGNISIDAKVDIITRSIFGTLHEKHGGEFPVLRGEETKWNFELKKPFWGGLFISRAVVSYHEGTGNIGGGDGGLEVKLKSDRVFFFSFPTFWGMLLELLILFVLFIFIMNILNRRYLRNWVKNHWKNYAVKPGENIQNIARRHKVPWKFLVKVNNLRPPYDITGESILVPPSKEKKETPKVEKPSAFKIIDKKSIKKVSQKTKAPVKKRLKKKSKI